MNIINSSVEIFFVIFLVRKARIHMLRMGDNIGSKDVTGVLVLM